MFNWNKKEKPFASFGGFGGGGLGLVGGVSIEPITASGGTKIPSGGNIYHVFTEPNSDNFVVSSGEGDIELLVIAGGGVVQLNMVVVEVQVVCFIIQVLL